MPKIKIEISNAQIDVLNEELSIFRSIAINRNAKVQKSILQPLAHKFLKKRMNDHPDNEKFNVSLTLYEGHYLEEFLKNLRSTANDYRNSTIAKLIFEINQNLA